MTETARTTAAADPAAPPPPPARATGTVPQPAHGVPDAPAAPRRLGVEEEFHLVDRVTRRLAPRAPELLDLLSSEDCYVAEMQQCVVETNTAVVDDLPALRNELIARRTRLAEAAAQLGLGIVAAGAVPLALPSEMSLTRAPRYRRMLADYQLLAREQLICGTQVHVDVADRDEAVAVANRVAPHLPTLLALSASSPYGSTGSDTGYASARTLVWQRWPTTGLASQTESAQDFDAMVAQLVDSGVITDPGMIYFDVRPSSQAPTLELRICDSCPSVDTIVLVAGLFRALVDREARARRDGIPAPEVLPVLGRAAVWRAARSGLEEDLVDVERARSRPARDVVHDLVASLEDDLRANGDWDTVRDLAESVLLAGSSAARQRRALRRRGRLTDVVDLLVAETSNAAIQALAPDGPDAILAAYLPTPAQEVAARDGAPAPAWYDEAVAADGTPREIYAGILGQLAALGPAALRHRDSRIEDLQRADGVTFKVVGHATPRVFPLDVVPRVVTAADWDTICRGAGQRTRALDHFIRDVYGSQAIVADGIVPEELLDRAPGYRSSGLLGGRGIRAHINGLDLVSDAPGRWCVLEDNLRIPSGIAYAMWNRDISRHFLPELPAPAGLLGVEEVPAMLLETLRASAPARGGDDPRVVVLTSGPEDSAYSEHSQLAASMGVPLVRPEDLVVDGAQLMRRSAGHSHPVHVVYARMDEDMLFSSAGADGVELRAGLIDGLHRGTLTIANALGNGVADDKAIYAYVPKMIEYYLGETPILTSVPTYVCAEREQRDHVLAHLDELVTKPIDGFGGVGVLIGPDASEAQLQERREDLTRQPEKFIAQEVVGLSTHPTFDGAALRPHHVDLRVFAHLRPGPDGGPARSVVMPAALTRCGAAGSKIVNSSAGGGSKDTWILGPSAGS